MSTDEYVFVDDLGDDPDPLLHQGGIESRYLGAVDDGRLTITDETNPASAWVTSTEYLSPDQYRRMRGGR